MAELPLFYEASGVSSKSIHLGAEAIAPASRATLQILRQDDLMREVVADDPFIPGQFEPIEVLIESGENAGFAIGRCGCRIEDDPAIGREKDFDPAMRVAGADNV